MHIITQPGFPYPIVVEGPRGQGLALTTDEAKELTARLFAAVLVPDTDDLPTGQRLSVWLDALSELVGLLDEEDAVDELTDVEGYAVGGRS